jgi:transcriptional regulator with XRE-family HTH domain
VRHARRRAGLSQAALAERLGVTQRLLSELETGKPKILDVRLFDVVSQLGIAVTWRSDA